MRDHQVVASADDVQCVQKEDHVEGSGPELALEVIGSVMQLCGVARGLRGEWPGTVPCGVGPGDSYALDLAPEVGFFEQLVGVGERAATPCGMRLEAPVLVQENALGALEDKRGIEARAEKLAVHELYAVHKTGVAVEDGVDALGEHVADASDDGTVHMPLELVHLDFHDELELLAELCGVFEVADERHFVSEGHPVLDALTESDAAASMRVVAAHDLPGAVGGPVILRDDGALAVDEDALECRDTLGYEGLPLSEEGPWIYRYEAGQIGLRPMKCPASELGKRMMNALVGDDVVRSLCAAIVSDDEWNAVLLSDQVVDRRSFAFVSKAETGYQNRSHAVS